MYAHQVIDSLSYYKKNYEKLGLFNHPAIPINGMNRLIKHIKDAQKFNLGEIDRFDQIERSNFGKYLFYGDTGGVRLPFNLCWFDWSVEEASDNRFFYSEKQKNIAEEIGVGKSQENAKNRGVLAFELDRSVVFAIPFCYVEKHKTWSPSLVGEMILVDHLIRENESIKEYIQKVYQSGQYEEFSNLNIFPVPLTTSISNQKLIGFHLENQDELTGLNTALLLLSCKNVGTSEEMPPDKLNKKRRKNGKQPLFTYKTLTIKPAKGSESGHDKNLWSNRIHLCRGHFKHYTQDAPLFGRYTGRFWWQPHTRGRNKKGVVHKDYQVEPT